jgi:hypothetical protein
MDRKVEVNVNGVQHMKSISSYSYCMRIMGSLDKIRNNTNGYMIHKLPTSSDRWCCRWNRTRKRRVGKQVVSCTAGGGQYHMLEQHVAGSECQSKTYRDSISSE